MLHLPVNALYTPHFICSTLHSTPYTLHSTFDMSHLTVNALYTPHFTHLYKLNLTLHTLHSKLYASHFTLRTPQSTLYTHTVHLALHTLRLHVALTLSSVRLRTLHFSLHVRPPQLCPFHTWHCMEPWPISIVMLRAHIYLSSWSFAARCVTSSHASKGPLRCRRWTFEFSPTLCTLHSAFYTPHFTL